MCLDSLFLTLAFADVWGLFYNVEFLIGIGVIAAARASVKMMSWLSRSSSFMSPSVATIPVT